ncbi:MAG: 4-alpha-glucanotransferase [Acidobacteriota bacterium]
MSAPAPPALSARIAGILLHVSSLPGRFGIGDLGPGAVTFLDWAARAGQSLWQVLPLAPTGGGHSPYGGSSAFAGNPLFLSPERLAAEGWLSESDFAAEDAGARSGGVDFSRVGPWKETVLRTAWGRFADRADGEARLAFERFRSAPEQAAWLDDWCLFDALHRRAGGAPWNSWEAGLAERDPASLARARRELAEEVAYSGWIQFQFDRQWGIVRREARARGISILGDLPIYVAHDSADVWAHRELFALDAEGRPARIAGVPPDYFSETGQLWGYPVYRWDANAAEGYAWWIERLRANLRLTDAVRIDHFRGFASYWEVEAGESTAVRGRWAAGPGRDLFDAARRALPALPLVAEDLGTITPDVSALLDELGIPGMKVLQFAFSEEDSPHLPHRHSENAVAYTGTHDNDTSRGWAAALTDSERERFRLYTGEDPVSAAALIRLAGASVARMAIVPLQDVLDLPSEARMNTPGRPAGNWSWRSAAADLTAERAAWLLRLARLTGRAPGAAKKS